MPSLAYQLKRAQLEPFSPAVLHPFVSFLPLFASLPLFSISHLFICPYRLAFALVSSPCSVLCPFSRPACLLKHFGPSACGHRPCCPFCRAFSGSPHCDGPPCFGLCAASRPCASRPSCGLHPSFLGSAVTACAPLSLCSLSVSHGSLPFLFSGGPAIPSAPALP